MIRLLRSISVLALLLCVQQLQAQHIYLVDAAHTANTTPVALTTVTAADWSNACSDLAAVLRTASAQPGTISSEVWVKGGVYKPTNGSSRDSAFCILRGGIRLYGGFAGTETSLSDRNPALHNTVLSGNIGNPDNTGDNSYHVLIVRPALAGNISGGSVVIDGLVICDGNAGGSGSFSVRGAAIARNSGGGLYNSSLSYSVSAPVVSNCVFLNNRSNTYGGAVYNDATGNGDGRPSIVNCVFSGNHSSNGGAVANRTGSSPGNASATFINCTFYNNTATGTGAAVYNAASTATCNPRFINSILWNNSSGSGDEVSNLNAAPVFLHSLTQFYTPGTAGSYGNISGNPLFADSSNLAGADSLWFSSDDGLQLQPGSPALDGGSNVLLSTTATDITGRTRIYGDSTDMGAYERQHLLFVDGSMAVSGNGSSWATAFRTLEEGLLAAAVGTEIWVKAGTYVPFGGNHVDSSFRIPSGASLYGGFEGWESSRSQRNTFLHASILSGEIGVPGHSDNVRSILKVISPDAPVLIDGFVISGGGDGNGSGAGLYTINGGSNLEVSNCRFLDNSAFYGGGIYSEGFNTACSPRIRNCFFHTNTSGYVGGAIFTRGLPMGKATIDNCVFYNCFASFGAAVACFYGGGADIRNATVFNCFANQGTFVYGINANDTVRVDNSVCWSYNNPPSSFTGSGTEFRVRYSVIQDGTYGGTGNSTADPAFVNSNDADGPDNIAGTPDDGIRPGFCSPLLNAGLNATAAAGTDISGLARITGGTVDQGAYEKQSDVVAGNNAALPDAASGSLAYLPVCEDNGWTYYAIPSMPDSVAFAIDWNGNTAARNNATLTLAVLGGNPLLTSSGSATALMRRYWNVALNGTALVNPVRIRFYYAAADTADMRAAISNWAGGVQPVSTVKWLKTVSSPFHPGVPNASGFNVPIQWLRPSAAGRTNNAAWVQFDSLWSFSGGGAVIHAGSSAPLPVQLKHFTALAREQQALLQWTVAEEEQLRAYIVERSANGRDFKTIGQVIPADKVYYSFTDPAPVPGSNYYRLRLQNTDGSHDYSRVQVLQFGRNEEPVSIRPVPAREEVILENRVEALNGTEAVIRNLTGIPVYQFLLGGSQRISISQWAPGLYLVQLADGRVLKLVKE